MVSTITCPITVAVVTFLVVLFNTCRSETSFSEDGDNKLTTNHQVEDNDTSEIQDKLKRESWAKFASWGKRGFNGKGFVAWGKRDSSYSDSDSLEEFPEKREDWSKLATWGKRSDSLSRQKREWKGFPSWGKRENLDTINGPLDDELKEEADKRKWNPIATWGKRMKDAGNMEAEKRRWSEFSSWGKRADDQSDMYDDSPEKRKWEKFSSWGKRSDDQMYKRKWFPLMSWGKRGDMSQEDKEQVKRAWSRFASWGKRYSAPRSWVSLGAWGKRRWTGMATWGKRSVNNDRDDVFAADTAQTLLPLFDLNGDDALDIGELQTYVRALFDLSKPEPEPKDDNSGHE